MIKDIFVITAPSGAGKTHLINYLKEKVANLDVCVSHTTRAKRKGEEDERDYFFVSEEEFERIEKVAGGFVEQAIVYGNRYGVSRRQLTKLIGQNKDILIEVDWQGARAIKREYPQAITIFILPPSLEQLEERLRRRGTDSPETIEARAKIFKEEIDKRNGFDYLVLNKDFDRACEELHSIIIAQRLRQERQEAVLKELISKLQ